MEIHKNGGIDSLLVISCCGGSLLEGYSSVSVEERGPLVT